MLFIGLVTQFLGFDLQNKKAFLYNGGTLRWHSTTIASIGDAVVGILSSPDTTRNRYLRVHDFHVNQLDILFILEEETRTKWTIVDIDIDVLAREAITRIQAGEITEDNIYTIFKAATFGKSSAPAAWGSEDDSRALGLQRKDLREEIRRFLQIAETPTRHCFTHTYLDRVYRSLNP